MRTDRARPVSLAVLTLVLCSLLIALPGTGGTARADPAADELGCGSAGVARALSTGSAWRMCVTIHPFKGLVLTDVQFRPASGDREYAGWMPVLDSLYLAQLNVPYDTGTYSFNDVTSYGFGDDYLLPQTSQTCAGDTMDIEQAYMRGTTWVERTVPGVCLREVDTGLGWHSQEGFVDSGDRYVQQGQALEVASLTKISWYEYQQTVTLTDQGTITVGLGATGDLAPGTAFFPTDPSLGWPIGPADEEPHRHGASHWHNATYRVDFGIGTGAQQVEQWDYRQAEDRPTRLHGTGTVQEQAFIADDPPPTTWWRVVNPTSLNPDGHPRSYEIVNDGLTNPYLSLTRPKVSFTNAHPCQEYASMNLNAGCPGQSVADYVAAETDPLTDPVAWVNVGFHHIDKDEDQSPMPVHWQSFSLAPRDFLAQQATAPPARSCDNGLTRGATGSCTAINTTPPEITTDAARPAPGTVLTATTGTWRYARAPLDHQWLWLRDGEPITTTGADGLPTSATSERYRVTAADVGHRIRVQVTASAAGVTPGSVTSAAVTIPRTTVGTRKVASTTNARANYMKRKQKAVVKAKVRATRAVSGKVRFVLRRNGKRVARTNDRLNRRDIAKVVFQKRQVRRSGRYQVVATYLGSSKVTRSRDIARFRVRR